MGKHYKWGLSAPRFVTAIPQNNSSSHNLRIAITGTLVVHALLLLLLAWIFARDVAMKLWQEANQPPKEKEVMLLFPDQILPPLPPPPPKHVTECGFGRGAEECGVHRGPQYEGGDGEGALSGCDGADADDGRAETADA